MNRPPASPSFRASSSPRSCAPTAVVSSRTFGHWLGIAPRCWPGGRGGCRKGAARPRIETPAHRLTDLASSCSGSALRRASRNRRTPGTKEASHATAGVVRWRQARLRAAYGAGATSSSPGGALFVGRSGRASSSGSASFSTRSTLALSRELALCSPVPGPSGELGEGAHCGRSAPPPRRQLCRSLCLRSTSATRLERAEAQRAARPNSMGTDKPADPDSEAAAHGREATFSHDGRG